MKEKEKKSLPKLPKIPSYFEGLFSQTRFRTLTLIAKDKNPYKTAKVCCATTVTGETDDSLIIKAAFSFCSPKEEHFWKKYGHRIAFMRLAKERKYVEVQISKKEKGILTTLYKALSDSNNDDKIGTPNWLRDYVPPTYDFDKV